MRHRTPTVVVGASIAGLHAATLIARAGRDVVVLERMRGLDPTPRALIVTATMLDLLGPVGADAVLTELSSYELIAGDRRLVGRLARSDLVIERATLIRSLAKEAASTGVRIEHDTRVLSISSDPGQPGVVVRRGVEEELIATRNVIVAGGALTPLVGSGPRVAPLIQALVDLPDDLASDRFRVWFRPEDTPYFLWLIPDGPTTGALGIIGEQGSRARKVLDAFITEQGLNARSYQAARIPIYDRWIEPHRRIGEVDVYRAGDTAGHVKVSTVGGVVTGLRGGIAAAASVLGRSDAKRLWHELRIELGAHLLARRALHSLDVRGYERLLSAAAPAAATIGAVDRDHAVRLMVGALARHPRLLAAAVGDLMRSKPFRPTSS